MHAKPRTETDSQSCHRCTAALRFFHSIQRIDDQTEGLVVAVLAFAVAERQPVEHAVLELQKRRQANRRRRIPRGAMHVADRAGPRGHLEHAHGRAARLAARLELLEGRREVAYVGHARPERGRCKRRVRVQPLRAREVARGRVLDPVADAHRKLHPFGNPVLDHSAPTDEVGPLRPLRDVNPHSNSKKVRPRLKFGEQSATISDVTVSSTVLVTTSSKISSFGSSGSFTTGTIVSSVLDARFLMWKGEHWDTNVKTIEFLPPAIAQKV